jgi:hypothetical protein
MVEYEKETRRKFFRDSDYIQAEYKREDEKLSRTFDFADQLGGDTISSVAYSAKSGLSLDSNSNTTTTVTVQVSKSGRLEITLTLASGDIWERIYRWSATDKTSDDYNG